MYREVSYGCSMKLIGESSLLPSDATCAKQGTKMLQNLRLEARNISKLSEAQVYALLIEREVNHIVQGRPDNA